MCSDRLNTIKNIYFPSQNICTAMEFPEYLQMSPILDIGKNLQNWPVFLKIPYNIFWSIKKIKSRVNDKRVKRGLKINNWLCWAKVFSGTANWKHLRVIFCFQNASAENSVLDCDIAGLNYPKMLPYALPPWSIPPILVHFDRLPFNWNLQIPAVCAHHVRRKRDQP